jgi:hypothetical protein
MRSLKTVCSFSAILLFFSLAFSPMTMAQIDDRSFSTIDEKAVSEVLPALLEQIEKAQSYPELVDIVNRFTTDMGRQPILVFLLELLIEGIGIRNNLNELRPLRRDAFVISWGFSHKINFLRENKFQLFRPVTLWYYTGPAKLLLNSRTVIIDLYPFSVKSLTGRQIGVMRNFAGLYVHRQSTLWDKSWTVMAGRAATVRGFDLSVFNVLNQ